ncbi:unnamed protein product [Fraxinus pennsylvanica]|uniref:Vacuolar sorting receptor thioredoxin-like domain-containing protein n=1 Tax=Fraxinus pennsylvanica TaxID=56036 RepID=A0AAD1ZAZ4_9LAMI|nr:unnamed protein product [Fraxinus pennsylvanica]
MKRTETSQEPETGQARLSVETETAPKETLKTEDVALQSITLAQTERKSSPPSAQSESLMNREKLHQAKHKKTTQLPWNLTKLNKNFDAITDAGAGGSVSLQLLADGYTQFTPHCITWYCPQAFTISKQCKSQCINHGRYCAPDPEQDFSSGYDGKDVVLENLRQLCVFKVANENKKPWVWWDYVTDFQIRCPMKEKKYNKECAEGVISSLGLDLKKIEKCMGDPNTDSDNPVLKEEQDAQIGKGSRGDVTILPTLVVNNRQYRGKLEKGAVLKAICAGFEETTEPSVCLSGDELLSGSYGSNGTLHDLPHHSPLGRADPARLILMNVKKRKLANALNVAATARIHRKRATEVKSAWAVSGGPNEGPMQASACTGLGSPHLVVGVAWLAEAEGFSILCLKIGVHVISGYALQFSSSSFEGCPSNTKTEVRFLLSSLAHPSSPGNKTSTTSRGSNCYCSTSSNVRDKVLNVWLLVERSKKDWPVQFELN